MTSTKLKHAERLQSATNAGDIIKENSSEFIQDFRTEKIPNSPLQVVFWPEEKKFGIHWGQYRITPDKINGETIQDAENWLSDNIITVIITLSTIVVQHQITEALVNTNKHIEQELKKEENKQAMQKMAEIETKLQSKIKN